jgi:hypothetical protein
MKQTANVVSMILLSVSLFCVQACAKKKEDCKTCTVRSSGTGQVIEERQVCTPAEESQFRSQYPDAPVTCE